MTGSNIMADKAFINQTVPLNKIKEVIETEDKKAKKVSVVSYHDTTMLSP